MTDGFCYLLGANRLLIPNSLSEDNLDINTPVTFTAVCILICICVLSTEDVISINRNILNMLFAQECVCVCVCVCERVCVCVLALEVCVCVFVCVSIKRAFVGK